MAVSQRMQDVSWGLPIVGGRARRSKPGERSSVSDPIRLKVSRPLVSLPPTDGPPPELKDERILIRRASFFISSIRDWHERMCTKPVNAACQLPQREPRGSLESRSFKCG